MGPGDTIAGKYALKSMLAQGGMGSVWIARHSLLDVDVAVKLMDPALVSSPEQRTRFGREAKSAAQIKSAHVVQVHDYGVDGSTPYIVMELLEGEDLGARIRREKRLAPRAVADLLTQIARGLGKAHELGIVHRDIKPANIFLAWGDDAEIVKILDFGIARATGSSGTSETTRTGDLIGSPPYMSPEQVRGRKDLDHRTDLWSVAVILYRATTGRLPFQSEQAGDLLVRICTESPPPPSSVAAGLPPGLDAFFERAFEREPQDRFASIRDLAEAFHGAIATPPAVVTTGPAVVAAPPAVATAGAGVVAAPAAPVRAASAAPSPMSMPAPALPGGTRPTSPGARSIPVTRPTAPLPAQAMPPAAAPVVPTGPGPAPSTGPVPPFVRAVTAPMPVDPAAHRASPGPARPIRGGGPPAAPAAPVVHPMGMTVPLGQVSPLAGRPLVVEAGPAVAEARTSTTPGAALSTRPEAPKSARAGLLVAVVSAVVVLAASAAAIAWRASRSTAAEGLSTEATVPSASTPNPTTSSDVAASADPSPQSPPTASAPPPSVTAPGTSILPLPTSGAAAEKSGTSTAPSAPTASARPGPGSVPRPSSTVKEPRISWD